MINLRKFSARQVVGFGFLLIAVGFVLSVALDVNPLVRADPEDRSLNELLDDMDIERLKGNAPVAVRLQGIGGAEIDVADFRGKVVFLNFWATWCAACVVEMPGMEKLYQQMPPDKFALMAVSIQEPAIDVKRYILLNRLTFQILLDSNGKTVPAFGIRQIPTTLILDETGQIMGRATGSREWGSRESIALFKRLTGGQKR